MAFWGGVIVGLVVAAGIAFAAWKLSIGKKVKKILEIVNGPLSEKEKIKAIADIFGISLPF